MYVGVSAKVDEARHVHHMKSMEEQGVIQQPLPEQEGDSGELRSPRSGKQCA